MAATYRVTGQRPSSHVTAAGQIEKTYELTFQTIPSGITGVIEIPVSQYNATTVDQLVGAQAANLEAIAAL